MSVVKVRIAAGVLMLALLPACKGSPAGPPPELVEGVDLSVLFAPPQAREIQEVLDDWSGRRPDARDVTVSLTRSFPIGSTPATLRVLSHTVDGNRHFGAVITPDGAGPLPVLVILHGGDEGVNISSTDLGAVLLALGEQGGDFVYVVPSFRSEPLNVNGTVFLSEGEPSPWDRDVDDAIALLNATFATTPRADPQRVGVLGFSRGGLVALLMAIRDARVDQVVEFFGPTDFFDPFAREVVIEALQGRPRDLPGLGFLDQRFLQPLKQGVLSEAQVRPELVRRSAVLFADRLPELQLHHGTADDVVEVSQARSLIRALERLGRGPPEFEGYLYEGGRHDPLTIPESIPRARAFLARLSAAR